MCTTYYVNYGEAFLTAAIPISCATKNLAVKEILLYSRVISEFFVTSTLLLCTSEVWQL